MGCSVVDLFGFEDVIFGACCHGMSRVWGLGGGGGGGGDEETTVGEGTLIEGEGAHVVACGGE
ncbi:unnamed protein product [Prunus armeniaca]|uniref:Uncharacterized protein n=1 Tax=Prunus armeniaca TaxID=36596 RepID=A0A6J5X8K2_PRUAR|nr:unnamed protein product [Prunus armeniaca]CAB4308873.1 unnamed protein product [Prunus armeniaca]